MAGELVRRLTDAQEEAVARRREPLLVAAGAGSGKTSVLVERFVRAVREDGIAPGAILAITFTERAAGELLERIGARLLALGETDAARELERTAYVGTFHGFCARVLRLHARARVQGASEGGLIEERDFGAIESSLTGHGFGALKSGLIERDFEILDEALSGRLRRQAFAAALGDFVAGAPRVGEQGRLEGLAETGEQGFAGARGRVGERSEAVDLIAAYGAERARATVLGTYAQLRSTGQRAPVLPSPVPGDQPGEHDAEAVRACALWGELLERFGAAYEASKRARGGLDFDDLELLTGELLAENADVREAWAGRFELLMVDELQDVSPRQLAIVQAIERENLFTVGDELQSIYGFRHADVGLFRARDAELAAHGRSLRLAHNFRGRRELLEAVNAVFAKRFGRAYTPLQAGREGARERVAQGEQVAQAALGERAAQDEAPIELLLTDKRGWEGRSERIVGGPASSAPRWRQAEARELARRVAELVRGGGGVGSRGRARSRCCCGRRATSSSTSARCASRA